VGLPTEAANVCAAKVGLPTEAANVCAAKVGSTWNEAALPPA
jgi:hypothetical protein